MVEQRIDKILETPAEWIEKHFYVPEPRDILTGRVLSPGPIRLAPYQRRLINEALSKDKNGLYKYSTVVYSAPKKSGKSAIGAAVTLWFAFHNPYSFVYCLANDRDQSKDRIFGPIRTCFELHRKHGGIFQNIVPNKDNVTFSNSTTIEALPCNAAGEAGSEPTFVCWSELWGFDTDKKIQLWTEMTIPPTKYGRAMRWVESYAGFTGVSVLLEDLYFTGTNKDLSIPHPDFPDLPVFVNKQAGLFFYWDHEPRMVWQTPEYYAEQAKMLTPAEFNRVHKNIWVSPVGAFVERDQWLMCKDDSFVYPVKSSRVPVIVAIDAAVTHDCAAMIAVCRDYESPTDSVMILDCKIFDPKFSGGRLNLEKTIGETLDNWLLKYNVVCVVYDPYQMENMIQNRRRGVGSYTLPMQRAVNAQTGQQEGAKVKGCWYYPFSQTTLRAVADKRLYDMIASRRIRYDPKHPDIGEFGERSTLTKHIMQAGAAQDKSRDAKLRIVKLHDSLKIDAAVALSMAVQQCMTLVLDNQMTNRDNIVRQYELGRITEAEMRQQLLIAGR